MLNFIRMLEREVQSAGSQKDAAKALGISPSYLNDLLLGRRKPSDSVLEKLGLEWRIVRRAS